MSVKVRVQDGKWGFFGTSGTTSRRYYGAGVKKRAEGDVFEIPSMDQFSEKWMQRVDKDEPVTAAPPDTGEPDVEIAPAIESPKPEKKGKGKKKFGFQRKSDD